MPTDYAQHAVMRETSAARARCDAHEVKAARRGNMRLVRRERKC